MEKINMRRIISQEEIEKKKKRNVTIIGMLLLGVMVFGTAGYAFLSSSSYGSNSENNKNPKAKGSVVDTGNGYAANFNDQTLYFTNSPESTENISVQMIATINNFVGAPLFIASNSSAITREIATNLGRYASRAQEACYGPCEKDLPEKNCTTNSENLIIWEDSQENKVYQDENCIFIEGDMRAVDAFLYKIFGFK